MLIKLATYFRLRATHHNILKLSRSNTVGRDKMLNRVYRVLDISSYQEFLA